MAFAKGRVLLRLTSATDGRGAAHEQVWASTDGGASWRNAVAATTTKAGRSAGPPGWRPGHVSLSFVPALLVRDDVWLVNVSDGTRFVAQCSRDNGRRWRSTCI